MATDSSASFLFFSFWFLPFLILSWMSPARAPSKESGTALTVAPLVIDLILVK